MGFRLRVPYLPIYSYTLYIPLFVLFHPPIKTFISHIQLCFKQCSAIDHTISTSEYNILPGSSYIKLPKEFDHPRKYLINIQNTDDNECFKWCLVRYLILGDHHPARISKAEKVFAKK